MLSWVGVVSCRCRSHCRWVGVGVVSVSVSVSVSLIESSRRTNERRTDGTQRRRGAPHLAPRYHISRAVTPAPAYRCLPPGICRKGQDPGGEDRARARGGSPLGGGRVAAGAGRILEGGSNGRIDPHPPFLLNSKSSQHVLGKRRPGMPTS